MISIKPKYMELILNGKKSIELRKCRPTVDFNQDTLIVLYCTSPIKAVVGFCVLKELLEDSPQSFWSKFSDSVGIAKNDFFEYYLNTDRVIGLKLDRIYQLNQPLPLDLIKEELPEFSPPQTYKYFRLKVLRQHFKNKLNGEYRELLKRVYISN